MSAESGGRADEARYVVGIDLGTTNTAVAFGELSAGPVLRDFAIEQLVAEGESAPRPALPSTIYLAGDQDVPAGALALPWEEDRRSVVGFLARRLGLRIAGRMITSAKSWLCHGGVDREAAILPWGGAADVRKLSPLAASARILAHVRGAWDVAHPEAPLARQRLVLAVPASFDEVARQLTVRAAEEAGLVDLRLIEEPQAAFYSWLAAHPDWRERLAGYSTILVVDVGGGTTDFSLIVVRRLASGLALERVAVGEHLLLGGDNMDLTLARAIAAEHAEAARLDAARWQQLVAMCRDAKERLLGEAPPEDVTLSVGGRGRGLIAGTVQASLKRATALEVVLEGFFPDVPLDCGGHMRSDAGLVEFGLPYASDPAITRHLARFLAAASADSTPISPDAVLFNGGALKPASLRTRIRDMLGTWFGARPVELEGADLDLAVARGAVAYGFARAGAGLRIAGGAPRSYYFGVEARGVTEGGPPRFLCIAPRGMEEGSEIEIREPQFVVKANQPVRFPLYTSRTRMGERGGDLIEAAPDSLDALPPLSTVLRFGRSQVAREIPVHLRARLLETGILEVSCLSKDTDHQWRLRLDLRGRARAGDSSGSPGEAAAEEQRLVLDEGRVADAISFLEECLSSAGDPTTLTRRLEEVLDAGKDAWPLPVLRRLWDSLLALGEARRRTPAHESRWLNLAGHLLRPGWGEERDAWRAEQLWRLFGSGLAFPGATQGQAEWWTMWKRVAGGLSRVQQQVVLQEIRPLLVPAARKRARASRWTSGPQEIREMWQVAGSLERIEAASKRELAEVLLPRIAKGKASDAEIWSFGRLSARAPVYGPANTIIPPDAIEPWLERLLLVAWPREAAMALAIAQLARLTGDRARDLGAELRARAAERLVSGDVGARYARWLTEVVRLDARQQGLVLADSLPIGLQLAEPGDTPAP